MPRLCSHLCYWSGGECKGWFSPATPTREKFPAVSQHLADPLELVIRVHSFLVWFLSQPWLSSGAPRYIILQISTSVLSLPTAIHSIGDEIPIITLSPSLLLFSMSFLYPLLCWSFSISPQFFPRKNCSICRCRLGVSMGKGELRVFLRHHLGPLFLNGKFLFLFVEDIWGTTFLDFNEKCNFCLYFSFQLVILMECLRMLCYAWSRIMNTYY